MRGGNLMSSNDSSAGLGYFHWNAGGWFGGQLGASAWLLSGAFWLYLQEPAVGAIWLACCAAINAVGTILWLNRSRIGPHLALQFLLATSGLSGIVAFYAANTVQPEAVREMGWPGSGYWALLIFPVLMIWFAAMEYGSRRRSQNPPPS
jgi:hypothetical protein